jgi:anti-anti-sigma factor
VAGDIDLGTVGDLRDHLALLVTWGTGDVAVNMADVTFCDATGLHVLVDACRDLQTSGRHIYVVHPSRSTMRVLQLTDLDGTLLANPASERTTPDGPRPRPRACRSVGGGHTDDRPAHEGGSGADR